MLLTRDALMEFKSIRLGPALKIIGYASYLRAKSRLLSMSRRQQRISNGPSRTEQVRRQQSPQKESGSAQGECSSSVADQIKTATPSLHSVVGADNSNLLSPPSSCIVSPKTDITPQGVPVTVAFQNVPGDYNIDDAIPLHNEAPFASENSSGMNIDIKES